jgi:hypothetical protein
MEEYSTKHWDSKRLSSPAPVLGNKSECVHE